MLSLLDAFYCYAQTFINKKEAGNTPQRAHRAVILMAVTSGCFLTGTLLFLVSFTLNLQQEVVLLPILLLTAVGFLTPYFYLNALFITKERYLLAGKLLAIKRFDKEAFLLLYISGFVYFVAITYIAGRLKR